MMKIFLATGNDLDSEWLEVLGKTLAPFGKLEITPSAEIRMRKNKRYNLIIVDAIDSGEMIKLVSDLHKESPQVPIVVVTASPTWQRARKFFLAGAIDYVRKSLIADELLKIFYEYLVSDVTN